MDSEYPHIAFLTYAKQFADAASAIVNSGCATEIRIAMSYLHGHAIELAVKSILLRNGICHKKLKKLGHNLEKCAEQANFCPEGKYLDSELQGIISLLNPVYAGKHLEYHPGTMLVDLPDEKSTQNSVDKLISSLRRTYTPARPPQRNM